MALGKLFDEKSGASAIEFAIVAPVFILLLLTTVAYGIYLYHVDAPGVGQHVGRFAVIK